MGGADCVLRADLHSRARIRRSATRRDEIRGVLGDWYKLSLALVRHTATYSPPVASRTLAYLGIVAFAATASGDRELQSLAGQLNGLKAGHEREAGQTYDDALVLDAAMAMTVQDLFSNTGP